MLHTSSFSVPIFLPLSVLFTVLLLTPVAAQLDVCGDGVCGPTENTYWCSVDCNGLCADTLCSRDESFSSCPECFCTVETEEEKLARLINEYRTTLGLSTIPIGRQISIVARAHARDMALARVTAPGCNLHSWSNNGGFDGMTFTGCCYTDVNPPTDCMWSKPSQLTNLTGNGFEISALFQSSVEEVLEGWQNSPFHDPIIANTGVWAGISWTFMGIGIDTVQNIYHVWFYAAPDDTVKKRDCKGFPSTSTASPSPSLVPASASPPTSSVPAPESPSPSPYTVSAASAPPSSSPSSSTIPPSATPTSSSSTATPAGPGTPAPSASFSPAVGGLPSSPAATPSSFPSLSSAPMKSTHSTTTPSPSCENDTFLKLSVVERIRNSTGTFHLSAMSLWSGNIIHYLSFPGKQRVIQLPSIDINLLKKKKTSAMLRFEMCTMTKLTLKYYKKNGTTPARKTSRAARQRNNGAAYDNLEKMIVDVFGKRKTKEKWAKAFVRLQVEVATVSRRKIVVMFKLRARQSKRSKRSKRSRK